MAGSRNDAVEHETNVAPQWLYTSQHATIPYAVETEPNLPEVHRYTEQDNPLVLATEKHDVPIDTAPVPRGKLICGIPKKRAILLSILLLVLSIIVGVVVGVVLGTRSKAAPPSKQIEQSPPPDTNTNSNKTAEEPKPMRNIVTIIDKRTMFNIWQKSERGLWMRVYFYATPEATHGEQKWSSAMELQMPVPAIDNTPLAAAAWQIKNYFEVRILYTAPSQSTISAMKFRCAANGTSCGDPEAVLIAESKALPPGAGSLLLTPAPDVVHLYTVNDNGLISETICNKNGVWSASRAISSSAKAHKSSPIAGAVFNGEINLFWFDENRRIFTITTSYPRVAWTKAQNISSAIIPSELPRALAVAPLNDARVIQLYYLNGTHVLQVKLSNGVWVPVEVGRSIPEATIPNGPLGAVAYNGTDMRMFFPANGTAGIRSVIPGLSDEGWAWGSSWEDEY